MRKTLLLNNPNITSRNLWWQSTSGKKVSFLLHICCYPVLNKKIISFVYFQYFKIFLWTFVHDSISQYCVVELNKKPLYTIWNKNFISFYLSYPWTTVFKCIFSPERDVKESQNLFSWKMAVIPLDYIITERKITENMKLKRRFIAYAKNYTSKYL